MLVVVQSLETETSFWMLAALQRLRASSQVEEDIEEMRAEERAHETESALSLSELLCSPTLRAPLVIGVVMQLSQQLSGINAVFYYSTDLFISSGLTEESAKFATIGIGVIMFVMTLVSLPLMDRAGRRTLHLYGLGGMFIFSVFITISFLIKVSNCYKAVGNVGCYSKQGCGTYPKFRCSENFFEFPYFLFSNIPCLLELYKKYSTLVIR